MVGALHVSSHDMSSKHILSPTYALLVPKRLVATSRQTTALKSHQVRQYAAYALVKVGQNSDVRKQVTEEGGLEPVLYLARTEEPEIQRETLACLCSLSFSEENKINITKYGGLPPVMGAIKSPDVETARMACCACANLCEVVENMDNIVDAGGIPALVQVCV